MHRVVLELDKKLVEGEILIYKDGRLESVEVHRLLPDLKEAIETIEAQGREINELKQTIANLAKIVKEK